MNTSTSQLYLIQCDVVSISANQLSIPYPSDWVIVVVFGIRVGTSWEADDLQMRLHADFNNRNETLVTQLNAELTSLGSDPFVVSVDLIAIRKLLAETIDLLARQPHIVPGIQPLRLQLRLFTHPHHHP